MDTPRDEEARLTRHERICIQAHFHALADEVGAEDVTGVIPESLYDEIQRIVDVRVAQAEGDRIKLIEELAELRAGDNWYVRAFSKVTESLDDLRKAAEHPYKGPNDTDVTMLYAAAKRLHGGYEPGGSNTKRTVAKVLEAVAVLLLASDTPSRIRPTETAP